MTYYKAISDLDLTKRNTEEPAEPPKVRFHYEPRYQTGKSVCGVISLFGWLAVGAGLILACLFVINVWDLYGKVDYIAAIPALSLIVGGFLNIALGQIGRAIIDNTNANLERLALMKRQTGE